MEHHLEFVRALVAKGGPEAADYDDLNSWIKEVAELGREGTPPAQYLTEIVKELGDAATAKTMQGFVLTKPHGYAGDFEIIDKIYLQHAATEPHLSRWDAYFHSHPATAAVRNRKTYFSETVKNVYERTGNKHIRVLNLASGPGRDMLHLLQTYPHLSETVTIDCVEQDQNAIKHAKHLLREHLNAITFYPKNVLRFQPKINTTSSGQRACSTTSVTAFSLRCCHE